MTSLPYGWVTGLSPWVLAGALSAAGNLEDVTNAQQRRARSGVRWLEVAAMNPTSDGCWLDMSPDRSFVDAHRVVVKFRGDVGLEARDVKRSRVDLIAGGNDVAHAKNHRAPFEPNWRKVTPLDPLANSRSMDTQSVCDVPDRSLTIATGAEEPAVVVEVEVAQKDRLRPWSATTCRERCR